MMFLGIILGITGFIFALFLAKVAIDDFLVPTLIGLCIIMSISTISVVTYDLGEKNRDIAIQNGADFKYELVTKENGTSYYKLKPKSKEDYKAVEELKVRKIDYEDLVVSYEVWKQKQLDLAFKKNKQLIEEYEKLLKEFEELKNE